MISVVSSTPHRPRSNFTNTAKSKNSLTTRYFISDGEALREPFEKAENGTQTHIGALKGDKCTRKNVIPGTRTVITPNLKPKRRKVRFMTWKKYHRLTVIYRFLDELEKDYPAICTVSVIGYSVEGRPIKMLKISNSDARNVAVWIDGLIHSREWISTAVVTYIADQIVRNFHKLSISFTNKDWYIVPVLNPDGYEYTHTTDRMWRKNRASYNGERVGVDLNRNFSGIKKNGQEFYSELSLYSHFKLLIEGEVPTGELVSDTFKPTSQKESSTVEAVYIIWAGISSEGRTDCGWGNNGENGSSENPSSVFFRGSAPFSEPEAAAVRDTILGASSTFKVYLSFHSYYELIIFPWGYKSEPCPDYLNLLQAATIMARAIFECTGKIYKVGSTKDMTYNACGTSTDWCYNTAKIPYSFMVELRSRKYRFRLPRDQILDTCHEVWDAVQSLMDYVDAH